MPRHLTSLAALLLLASPGFAEKGDTWTDPEDVPPSYAIQGEYVGKAGDMPAGAQVVALGNDEFQLEVFAGGLPGAGWSRGDHHKSAKGKLVDGKVMFEDGDRSAVITSGAVILTDGTGTYTLAKTIRKSPTLGAKPPEGALVLFDGKSADAWKGGKIEMKDLLAANTESLEKFGDHSFHLEFRTPYKPKARDQARGNSGVYLQGRYEVQVLDSFGLDGADNECGGIYKIAKPIVNMCLPPLTWQTYDVDFTAARYEDGKKVQNARVTIKHNGVVIHDALELPSNTPGKYSEAETPGPIYLQGHGNPVVYRNIWVVKK